MLSIVDPPTCLSPFAIEVPLVVADSCSAPTIALRGFLRPAVAAAHVEKAKIAGYHIGKITAQDMGAPVVNVAVMYRLHHAHRQRVPNVRIKLLDSAARKPFALSIVPATSECMVPPQPRRPKSVGPYWLRATRGEGEPTVKASMTIDRSAVYRYLQKTLPVGYPLTWRGSTGRDGFRVRQPTGFYGCQPREIPGR